MSRRTKADREREWQQARDREWEQFRPKLAALQTFADAMALVDQAPRPDTPGRKFYSNLGFFLQAFTVPDGSNGEERALYLEFVRRLDAAGGLKPGALERIEEDFRRARAPSWY